MGVDVEKLLDTALQEVRSSKQKDELEERFNRLEQRNVSMSDVMSALEKASDEELDALKHTILGGQAAEIQAEREAQEAAEQDTKPKPTPAEKPRTRPGRKSGAAYDWWIDDESGEVVKLPVARVYTGEDEDDEVEIRQAEQE